MNKDIFYEYNPWWEGISDPTNRIERLALLDRMETDLTIPGIILLTGHSS